MDWPRRVMRPDGASSGIRSCYGLGGRPSPSPRLPQVHHWSTPPPSKVADYLAHGAPGELATPTRPTGRVQ